MKKNATLVLSAVLSMMFMVGCSASRENADKALAETFPDAEIVGRQGDIYFLCYQFELTIATADRSFGSTSFPDRQIIHVPITSATCKIEAKR